MPLGPKISGWLPELNLRLDGTYNDEIFIRDDNTLFWVLSQGNPVYLVLDLPGLLLESRVSVCFPTPCITRIYTANRVNGNDSLEESLLCEVNDKSRIYEAPTQVDYRFGMRLVPWMFLHLLDTTHQVNKDHVVNYVVLNSVVGHTGVLIRLFRKFGYSQKQDEWLELYHFSTGNDYHFFERGRTDPNTKLMARFVPKNAGTPRVIWVPKGQDSGHNVKVP